MNDDRSLTIRRATYDDLAALLEIEHASFPGNRLDRRRFRYLLGTAHGVILVDTAAAGGAVRGYILLLLRANSRVARVYSIATHPAHLKRGVADALLRAAERLALSLGRQRQRCEIRVDNAPSLALFARHGYHVFGRHLAYYEDGLDALRLEKTLVE